MFNDKGLIRLIDYGFLMTLKTKSFILAFTLLSTLLIISQVNFLPPSKAYTDAFAIRLTASINGYSASCMCGINPNAPMTYSSLYDSIAFDTPPAGLNTGINCWFSYYNTSYYHDEMKLSKYIIPSNGTAEWFLGMQIYGFGTLTLTWSEPWIGNNATLTLEDGLIKRPLVDMKAVSNYSFYTEGGGQPDYFYIAYNSNSYPTQTPTPTPTQSATPTISQSPTPSVPEFSWLTILPLLLTIQLLLLWFERDFTERFTLKGMSEQTLTKSFVKRPFISQLFK